MRRAAGPAYRLLMLWPEQLRSPKPEEFVQVAELKFNGKAVPDLGGGEAFRQFLLVDLEQQPLCGDAA